MLSNPTSDHISQRITSLLSSLEPNRLEVQDETHKHLKHAGHTPGTFHYHLLISSDQLNALNSRIERHRAIYQLIKPVQPWIHSLRISIE